MRDTLHYSFIKSDWQHLQQNHIGPTERHCRAAGKSTRVGNKKHQKGEIKKSWWKEIHSQKWPKKKKKKITLVSALSQWKYTEQTRKRKCETGLGYNLSLTMNSGFPAGHGRTLVTLETQRADKSQLNKGSNNNAGRLDCVTLQWGVRGVWVNLISHNLPSEMSNKFKFSSLIRLLQYEIWLKNTVIGKNENISNDKDWQTFSSKMHIVKTVAKMCFLQLKCSILTSRASSVAQ